DTLEEARAALRYSVADSPLFRAFEERLPSVEAVFGPHAEVLGETAGYKLLAEAAMDAISLLDQTGLFGTGAVREQILLIFITDDTEVDWTLPSAKRLNPASVFERFEKATRIEGTYSSCHALAASPDGRTLYTGGSRKNP